MAAPAGPRARVFALLLAGAWLALAAPTRGVEPGEIVVADFPPAPAPSALVLFNAAGNPIGPFTMAAVQAPRDLAFDAAGNLHVADNTAVLIFDGNGALVGSISQALSKAIALTFDASGNLFVSNRISGGSSEIVKYSPGGAWLETWVIPEFDNGGPAPFAREITFGPGGMLYLALRGSNTSSNDNLVATLDVQTGDFVAFADAADQVTQPIGLAFEPGGTLLVANDTGTQSTQASRIVRLDANGDFAEEFWNQDAVRDLVFDGFGQLHGVNRLGDVTLWNPDGSFKKAYGAASLVAPIALALISASAPFCQNEILEAGEECDDGNAAACDGCSAACELEFGCGDGSVCGVEECDDGNAATCDGCSPSCVVESCGDGMLCASPPLGEVCDDGNTDPCDGCSPSCTPEVCGNGILDCGEECDDTNPQACDGCSACRVDELVYLDDVESGPNGWSATGLWNQDDFRSVSPTHAWYYGQTTFRNYQTLFPGTNSGTVTSPSIDLTGVSGVELSFSYYLETQNEPGFDIASVEVSRDGFVSDVVVLESQLPDQAVFTEREFGLSALTGGLLQVRFSFDTVDDVDNHFEGFYVDDAVIRASGPIVCGNGIAAAACGETCDDGNTQGGDGCSAECELEGVTDQVAFSGTAQGGSIEVTVSGVPLSAPTSVGESSADVATAVAAAINGDLTLQGLGVSAASSLGVLFVIEGTIDAAASADPGIEIQVADPVPALPPLGRLALVLSLCAAILAMGRRLPRA